MQSVAKRSRPPIPAFVEEKFGWGGRIRTFTVLINSEVSYQLDHAPAACRGPPAGRSQAEESRLRRNKSGGGYLQDTTTLPLTDALIKDVCEKMFELLDSLLHQTPDGGLVHEEQGSTNG